MRSAFLLIAAALASACATTSTTTAAQGVVAAPSGDGDVIVGALADASLQKGDCGMILWTLEANSPAAIFKMTADKGAEIVINGKPVKLSVVATAGAAGFGVFEESKLAADGLSASVKVRFGLGFEGGSYVERGLLTVESASGWRTVIPAAGVAGCRAR